MNKRGHFIDDTIRATKLLKDAGFKICYHMMPDLYGSSYERDKSMFDKLFACPDFQPDMLKIYPCVVTKYAKLQKLHKEHKFIPYSDAELTRLLIDVKKCLPEYVRVQRLIRDIPKQNILGGSTVSNLRQVIHNDMYKKHGRNMCKCIRCREIRGDKRLPVKIKRIDYNASDGKEIFLQYVDRNNKIYALLRLRISGLMCNGHSELVEESQDPSTRKLAQDDKNADNYNLQQDNNHWIPELTGCAMIREVHTYGQLVPIGMKILKDPQHSGLGKELILRAQKIAKDEFGIQEMAVISGVGVRGYYKKLGYNIEGTYMVKSL